ncbi:MAG TPA: TIGR04282 family arsenosugar biosynthesis glycosyltransferase [Alphaproteobacteria bacterium]|nr:TIGR04282 family arsenosugar biosynthesis glycosyltransferase [Alphaproteobacteria bacterium]
MTPTRWLVVMAKSPRAGSAKRRLARDIGSVAALRFYRATLARLLRRLARDPRWKVVLYISPDRDVFARGLWPRGVARRAQGPGDLGARMRRPLAELGPGPVAIVGGDIPDLGPRHVAAAFKALGSHDLVFGPASDGGYWLVGAKRRPRTPLLFHRVRWSSEHALRDTLDGVGTRLRVAMLETLDDVDNGSDYARFKCSRSRGMSSTRLQGR